MGLIVLIIIIILLVGVFPTWPHSQSWGYGPSGILGTNLYSFSYSFSSGVYKERFQAARQSAAPSFQRYSNSRSWGRI